MSSLYSYFLFYIKYFYFFVYFLIIKFPVASKSIIIIFFSLILIAILKYVLVIIIYFKIILFSFCWPLLSVNFKFFPIFYTDINSFCSRDYLGEIWTIFLLYNIPNSEKKYISFSIFVYSYQVYYILLLIFFIAITLLRT